MIQRRLSKTIESKLFSGKAIVIMGARQTGKTTLAKALLSGRDDVLWLNGDEQFVRDLMENISVAKYKSLIGDNQIIVIDEAQRIADIGIKTKLLTDNFKDKQVILTGSSSFELANKINEPLTGRKWEYRMYPLSFGEMSAHFGMLQEIQNLPLRLVYGCYPDVVCHQGSEREVLTQLADSYLYKDVLEWEKLKKPEKLIKLLQALAYQVGSEVSYSELGTLVGIDNETTEKYITLLEQTHVIFRLGSFSRNLRNELKFAKKVYFYDNGIRNALIHNFADISLRADNGELWENFMVSELRKRADYNGLYAHSYFWRTTDRKEIDYIEECDGRITAYEFKWNPRKKGKKIQQFLDAYPNATLQTVNRDNYYQYLL